MYGICLLVPLKLYIPFFCSCTPFEITVNHEHGCITIAEQAEKLLSDMSRHSAIFKWSRWKSSGTTTLDYKTLYNGSDISPAFSYEGEHHPR
jgi:hypothetical protein